MQADSPRVPRAAFDPAPLPLGCDLKFTSFLIPWGVILYTAAGGLKATFLASYVHTAIIFLVLLTMACDEQLVHSRWSNKLVPQEI